MSDTTSTAKHTPGPWKAEKYCIWANNHNGSVYIAGTQTGIDTDQQKANARLIAAAPDLLEAAKIVAYWELSDSQLTESTRGEFADGVGGGRVNRQDYRKAFDTLRAAIAKAEGR